MYKIFEGDLLIAYVYTKEEADEYREAGYIVIPSVDVST